MTKEEAIKNFEEFDLELDYYIDFLTQLAQEYDEKYLPLDYSIASLKNIENLYRDYLEKKIGNEIPGTNMKLWVGAYLGFTLVKEFGGGKWEVELDKKLINFGMRGITAIPKLAPSYSWCPFIVINNFAYNKPAGLFEMSIISHYDWIKK